MFVGIGESGGRVASGRISGMDDKASGPEREIERLKEENDKLRLSNRVLLKELAERKRAERQLRASERKFAVLAEHSPNMIFIIRRERVVYVNRRCSDLLNYDKGEFYSPEFTIFDIFAPESRKNAKLNFEKQMDGAPVPPCEYTLATKDGRTVDVIISTELIQLEGEPTILGIVTDISDRKRAEEHLAYMARHDSLSGLPNRDLFNYRLALAIMKSKRNRQRLAVMLLDLDNFKSVNDTLGHDIGDHLLRLVSRRLSELLRKGDTIARMGGDEFLLLLPSIDGLKSAESIASRILEAVRAPYIIDEHTLNVTISIGIAVFPTDGKDVVTLVRNADIAMYRAKSAGKDRYVKYDAHAAQRKAG